MMISISLADLMSANRKLVEDTKKELERDIAESNSISYLTQEMVIKKLNVTSTTLWRWRKAGYLVPINVGGQNRYKSTDIDKILGV